MENDDIVIEAAALAESRARSLASMELPHEITASMERHKVRVAELVLALRSAGMPDDMIRSSVRTVIASYEDELTAAISASREI